VRGWGWGSEGTTSTLRARHFRGARLSTPMSVYLQEDRSSINEQSKSENLQWKIRSRELTSWSAPGASSSGGPTSHVQGLHASSPARGLHASGPPTLGLLRFGPPPRRWQRSPVCSRANPPTPATAGVGPWPPSVTRETWTFGAPPPRISNDCRRRGAAPDSTACDALDVDAESVDFPHDRRLCRESESGRSEPS
jgi:hypothetical protein